MSNKTDSFKRNFKSIDKKEETLSSNPIRNSLDSHKKIKHFSESGNQNYYRINDHKADDALFRETFKILFNNQAPVENKSPTIQKIPSKSKTKKEAEISSLVTSSWKYSHTEADNEIEK